MNKKIEQMTELAYLTLIKITIPGTQLPIIVVSLFNYLYYGMDEDSFSLPFYVLYVFRPNYISHCLLIFFVKFRSQRLPFNWKTPFGYFIATQLEFFGSLSIVLITFAVITNYFGSCWLITVFVKDIGENDVSQLNLNASGPNKKKKMIDRFRKLVYNFSEVKQLSDE